MSERLLLTIASAPPATTEPAGDPPPPTESGLASSVSDVFTTVVDNLGNNGYQTGVSLLVATAAVVTMLNLRVNKWIVAVVAIGAFWAGWLGFNTLTAQDNPLFPGDVSATKLWDVARAGDTGFLLFAGVACVAAIFVWKSGLNLVSKIALLFGAVLGASFVYNLVEAVQQA